MTTLPSLPPLPSLTGTARAAREWFTPLQDEGDGPTEARRASIDTAVRLNRRSTPQDVLDKRDRPRLSVAETNELSSEDLADRFAAVRDLDDRPGLLKVLDVLDLPRRAVAGVIGDVFPAVQEAAIRRGSVDRFGEPIVFGADILRSMGISNRVVNGIGGFAIDVVTDPLSWIGGPIGGVKSAGASGVRATVAGAGQKALRRGLRVAATKGIGAVSQPAVRELIESAAESAGKSFATDAVAASRAAADMILGNLTPVRDALGRVGFGQSGTATLADDLVATATGKSAAEARRIAASKAFIAQFSRNPGIKIGGDRAVTSLAHVPLTDITLYAPAFTRRGREAAAQRAVALATAGSPALGVAIQATARIAGDAEAAAREASDASDALRQAIQAGNQAAIDAAQTRIADASTRVEQVREAIRAGRAQDAAGLRSTPAIDNIGDLVATAEYARRASAGADLAAAQLRWADVSAGTLRATPEDIRAVRHANRVADDAARIELAELIADPAVSQATKDEAVSELRSLYAGQALGRLTDLANLSERELEAAEAVADAFNASAQAAQELAAAARVPAMSLLNAEQRQLADAARFVLGMSSDVLPTMPFASFESAARNAGRTGAAKVFALAGSAVARTFGLSGGLVGQKAASVRNAITEAAPVSDQVRTMFMRGGGRVSKGLRAIMDAHGIEAKHDRAMGHLLTAIVERDLYAARPADARRWATRADGSPVAADGGVARLTQSLGTARINAAMPDLMQLASEVRTTLSDMAEAAVRRGDLDTPMSEYIPLAMTAETLARARQIAATSPDAAQRRVAEGVLAIADPNKPRSTVEIRFADSQGQNRSILRMFADVFGGLDPQTIEAMSDPTARAFAAKQAETIAAFRERYPGLSFDDAARMFGRPVHPNELNSMAKEGAFRGLVGGDDLADPRIFETDLGSLLAVRSVADVREQALDAMRELVYPYAMRAENTNALSSIPVGQDAVLPGGQRLTRLASDGRSGLLRFRAGDTVYRNADIGAIEGSLASDLLLDGRFFDQVLLPEGVAEQVERLARATRPSQLSGVFRTANAFTSLWRSATLLHPSWFVGNVIGSSLLAAMMFPRPDSFGKFSRNIVPAIRAITQGSSLGVASAIVDVGGRQVPLADVLALAKRERVVQSGAAAETMQQFSDQARASAQRSLTGRSTGDILAEELSLNAARASSGQPSPASRMASHGRAMLGPAGETLRRMHRSWFEINGATDDVFRLAAFMTILDRGADAAEAAAQVKRGMLNFGDLTEVERYKLRPFLPFYAWMRATIPNFLARTIDRPADVALVPKLQQAIEESANGEDRLPIHMRPQWLQGQAAIQLGTDPQTRQAFSVLTLLPQEGAINILSGLFGPRDFLESLDTIAGQAGPALKVPLELATGRETFSGRTIGASRYEGDISLPEYLLGQLRPLRELGVGSVREGPLIRAAGEGPLSLAGRLAFGGRLQPHLQDERRLASLARQLSERENAIKAAIRTAEREGREDLVLEGEARLLDAYADHIEAGGEQRAVPRKYLAMLAEMRGLAAQDGL